MENCMHAVCLMLVNHLAFHPVGGYQLLLMSVDRCRYKILIHPVHCWLLEFEVPTSQCLRCPLLGLIVMIS